MEQLAFATRSIVHNGATAQHVTAILQSIVDHDDDARRQYERYLHELLAHTDMPGDAEDAEAIRRSLTLVSDAADRSISTARRLARSSYRRTYLMPYETVAGGF